MLNKPGKLPPVPKIAHPKLPPIPVLVNPAQKTAAAELLSEKHFIAAVVVALSLHLFVVVVWQLLPKPQVIDIPVRPLNLKIGDVDIKYDVRDVAPHAANAADVEKTLSKVIQVPDSARTETVVGSMEKAMSDLSQGAAEDVMHQYVRAGEEAPVPAAPTDEKGTAIKTRYEQMVTAWVQKFKNIPDEARAQGLQGETIVRVRTDRRGNVRYYMLERSTGHAALDRAAIDMIRRANPVPAVPNDYPPGDTVEFLIPVSFRL